MTQADKIYEEPRGKTTGFFIQRRFKTISLDQFIGLKEHFRWDPEAKLLGGLKIDDQFKLG